MKKACRRCEKQSKLQNKPVERMCKGWRKLFEWHSNSSKRDRIEEIGQRIVEHKEDAFNGNTLRGGT